MGLVRVGNFLIDRDCFVPHPGGQQLAMRASSAVGLEAVESLRAEADALGIVNSGILAPDTEEPDVLSCYLTRRGTVLSGPKPPGPGSTTGRSAA
jgi:hypothetical protein